MKSQRSLLVATGLGAAQALWSLFQWKELLDLRRGAEAFCIGGGTGCEEVWDSAFASSIQDATGLPVAGWGLAWGLVATALPLLLWMRQRRGGALRALRSATIWTALGGAVAVMGLASSLLFVGRVCSTCAVTYALVIAYAATVLLPAASSRVAQAWVKGGFVALGATALAYLALLYPGLQTPPSVHGSVAEVRGGGPLEEWVAELKPPVQQMLADTLYVYSHSEARPLRRPRALLGDADAPVRITDFVDMRCSHCAHLHEALAELRTSLPRGSFAIESRHFPLDATCNPLVTRKAAAPTRCTAAKALICVEDPEKAFSLERDLFHRPGELSDAEILSMGARYVSRTELEACVDSPETEARLRDDIAWAQEYGIQGTPLVLVNGREGSAFPPFLYAVILAGGRADHPAFASLPPPSERVRR